MGAVFMFANIQKSPGRIIRVALSGPWNTIHPGLQHSLDADLVLSNQFEALVGLNDNGVSVPLGATSWTVSDDFRKYRFKINTSRTFPDGSHLTAFDFKRSWEEAVRLEPVSANSSLLDVLYKIEGFESFDQSGTIAGLRAIDDSTLEIVFSSPFRMALEHLQGNRFAAFKERDGKFLGTGVFQIEEIGEHHIIMHPRTEPQFAGIPTLDVRYIQADSIISTLLEGETDAIFYLTGNSPQIERLDDPKVQTLAGQDSLNLALGLNQNRHSPFSIQENRLALQYLVGKAASEHPEFLPRKSYFDTDPQFFMPIQSGRLENEEVKALTDAGQRYVHQLMEVSKAKPLMVKSTMSNARIIELVKSTGLSLDARSGPISAKEFFETVYASDGPDILISGFSVASGDPDGLYHILGEKGAIRCPYVYSRMVGDLLEEGRKIIGVENLDLHYKIVSRALFTEAPMIHLGFAKAVLAYRKDRVDVDTTVLRRNQGQMHFLRAKP